MGPVVKIPAGAGLPLALAGLAVLAVGAFALYAFKRGGVTAAAAGVGAAAVNAAGGLVSGGVGAAGAAVGLPTPDQTITDPAQVRWIIDAYGYFAASKWAGAGALAQAMWRPAGSGTRPPANSPALAALGPAPAATPASVPVLLTGPSSYAPPASASFLDLVNSDPYEPWKGN